MEKQQTGSKLKVLYILGHERCGSTLLDRVLGEVEQFAALGEIRDLWRFYQQPRRCGCGLSLPECPFWQQVLTTAFGEIDAAFIGRMAQQYESIHAIDHIKYSLPFGKRALFSRIQDFLDATERLYPAIQQVSGCKVIVDSTKSPLYARVLAGVPNLDLYYIHLIRDSRGIGYSLLKRKQDGHSTYRSYNAWKGALLWNQNYWVSPFLLDAPANRYLVLRYEDFMADPTATLRQILSFVEEPTLQLPAIHNNQINLIPSHTAAGSPSRFKTGMIQLKEDSGWREKLQPRDRAIFTALTFPLLARHGYL